MDKTPEECSMCHGTGNMLGDPCNLCKGTGNIEFDFACRWICVACGKAYGNGTGAGELPTEAGHCPRCILSLEKAANQKEFDDMAKEEPASSLDEARRILKERGIASNSITGKAITRCKDCAAWEHVKSMGNIGRCSLSPPALGQATDTSDDRDWIYPETGPNDGCTEAPDWTVELSPRESKEIHDRISMLYRKMCKRLEELENTRREDADWSDSTNKDHLNLRDRLRILEQQLKDINDVPMLRKSVMNLQRAKVSLCNRLTAFEDSTGPDAAGIMRMDAFDERIQVLENRIEDARQRGCLCNCGPTEGCHVCDPGARNGPSPANYGLLFNKRAEIERIITDKLHNSFSWNTAKKITKQIIKQIDKLAKAPGEYSNE